MTFNPFKSTGMNGPMPLPPDAERPIVEPAKQQYLYNPPDRGMQRRVEIVRPDSNDSDMVWVRITGSDDTAPEMLVIADDLIPVG